MSRVTRSSGKLDDDVPHTRSRSSSVVKESNTPMKKPNASIPMVSSHGVRRSPRVVKPSKKSSASRSSEKSKRQDGLMPLTVSTAGTKRKSTGDRKDSLLPPTKRRSLSDEKQTTDNSPITRSRNSLDKNVEKSKVQGGSSSKKLKKKKITMKSKKSKKSRKVSSLVANRDEGGKASSVSSRDSRPGEEQEGKSLSETPRLSKKEQQKSVGETPRESKNKKDGAIEETPITFSKDESTVSGEASISKPSGSKCFASIRLDARSYRKLFTSKKNPVFVDQSQERRCSSSCDDNNLHKDAIEVDYGDRETVSSHPLLETIDVATQDNINIDGVVKGVEESADVHSNKATNKNDCIREDDMGGNIKKNGTLDTTQDYPSTIEINQRSVSETHQCNDKLLDDRLGSLERLSPMNNDALCDRDASDYQLPHIDTKDVGSMLPGENGKLHTVDTTQSAENNPSQEDAQLDPRTLGQVFGIAECNDQTTLEMPTHEEAVGPSESKKDRSRQRPEGAAAAERLESPKKKYRTGDISVNTQDRKRLHGINESDPLNHSQTKGSKLDDTDNSTCNACGICKLGGKLLCCDGTDCKQAYHLSCLTPPLEDVPPGVWHCLSCVKRKLKSGPHSVSGNVESIWAVRCSEVSGDKGCNLMENKVQKEYLVKYRSLAHIHNLWIPENQLLDDAPKLLAAFKNKHQRNKAMKWNPDWIEPQRLLKRRLLMPQELAEDYFHNNGCTLPCNAEWFVKWKGLGYEFATWELETSSFFKCEKGLMLLKDYDLRHQKAKHAPDLCRPDTRISNGNTHGQDCNASKFVDKLQEYWRDHRNAVVIDDQERINRAILLITSLVPCVSRPFLIVSTSAALPSWESEILLANPAINLVVYNGNKDVRNMIRKLEFYEEHGSVMFQVLLSTPDAVAEDVESLEYIGWEAVIVDECHTLRISKHFEKIKRLNTDFRLLIFSGQIKDSIAEYLNVLSFIDAMNDFNCINSSNDDNNSEVLLMLKQKFMSKIAYRHEPTSKFEEYWVPALLSDVQLEKYCKILVTNNISLCAKSDPCDTLLSILLLLKKCCDHPYLVDDSLQQTLTKGLLETEFLDVGVRASAKLQLLDKLLLEFKRRSLRVLILFQLIGGSGPLSIGDILDDYLRQRFGADSYERVDSGLLSSKKQAALNRFHDKERGCFVFLLENRACLPSIRLSSVDTIIIFDSDWDPSNDLRALHKISVDSTFEHPVVLRLYSPYTIEEEVLILSTKETVLENNLKNVSANIRHRLLMWGSTYLFEKFDELKKKHDLLKSYSVPWTDSILSHEQNLLEKVLQGMETLLHTVPNTKYEYTHSTVCKVTQNGSLYSKLGLLVGEAQPEVANVDQPSVYWKSLLERFNLKHVDIQRQRRSVLDFRSLKMPQVVNKNSRKQTKVGDNGKLASSSSQMHSAGKTLKGDRSSSTIVSDQPNTSPLSAMGTGGMLLNQNGKESTSVTPRKDIVPETLNIDGAQTGIVQENLHDCLKPEVLKLCFTLEFPKEVMDAAATSLEYVMKNHQVPREPESILQAFQMALCWTAASILKHDINRKASIVLAHEHLHFTCTKPEVKSVYKKLLQIRPYLKSYYKSATSSDTRSLDEAQKGNSVHHNEHRKVQAEAELTEETMNAMNNEQHLGTKDQVSGPKLEKVRKNQTSSDDETRKNQTSSDVLNGLLSTRKKRLKYIRQKRKEVLLDFKEFGDMEAAKMAEEYERHDANVLKEYQNDSSILAEKRKVLKQEFCDRRAGLRERIKVCEKVLLNRLKELQEREDEIYSYWLEEANTGRPVGPYFVLALPDIPFQKELLTEVQQLADEPPQSMPQLISSKVVSVPAEEDDQSVFDELHSVNAGSSFVHVTVSAQSTDCRVTESGLVLKQLNTSVHQGEQPTISVSQEVNTVLPISEFSNALTVQNEQENADKAAVITEPNGTTIINPVPRFLTKMSYEAANETGPNIEASLANHDTVYSGPISMNRNASANEIGFESPTSLIEQNRQLDSATNPMEPDILHEISCEVANERDPNIEASLANHDTISSGSILRNENASSSERSADLRFESPTSLIGQNKQLEAATNSMEPDILHETSCEVSNERDPNIEVSLEHHDMASSALILKSQNPSIDERSADLGLEIPNLLIEQNESPDNAMDKVPKLFNESLGAEMYTDVGEHAVEDGPLLQRTDSIQTADAQCSELNLNHVEQENVAANSTEADICAVPNCDTQAPNFFNETSTAKTHSGVEARVICDDSLLQQTSSQIVAIRCPNLSHNQVSAEFGRESEDGFTGSEPVHVSQSSAEQLLPVSCTDPMEWCQVEEVSREHSHIVGTDPSPPRDRVREQQSFNALDASAEQIVEPFPIFQSTTSHTQFLPSLVVSEPAPLENLRHRSNSMEPAGHGVQATQAPRSAPMNTVDILYHEILRLRKEDEQKKKLYEDEKMRLTQQCEKDLEEIKRKYAMLLQDLDARQIESQKDIDDNINKVSLNRHLADSFKFLTVDPRLLHSGTSLAPQQSGNNPQVSVAHRPEGISPEYRFGPLSPNLQPSFTNLNSRWPVAPPNAVQSPRSFGEPTFPRMSQQIEDPPRPPLAFPLVRFQTGSTAVPCIGGLPSDFASNSGAVQPPPGNMNNRMFEPPSIPVLSNTTSVRLTVEPLCNSNLNEGAANPEVVCLSDDD